MDMKETMHGTNVFKLVWLRYMLRMWPHYSSYSPAPAASAVQYSAQD